MDAEPAVACEHEMMSKKHFVVSRGCESTQNSTDDANTATIWFADAGRYKSSTKIG